uniref:DIV2B protein n=1 Tax=Heptacodium miconioides TaxID=137004 RepID=C5I9W3_9DIPS|nr:DIV2B protein [Heptacodium miconioides]
METLYPTSYISNMNWFMEESTSKNWTREENKRFESALAIFDKETPDRWTKVAEMIPGKSVLDVIEQYKELVADVTDIEAGLVPIPGYLTSSFTLELVDNRRFGDFRKRASLGRSSDQERKKGVPWTEDEHRRFLMGLEKHGRGDWRNISRNFVITKTPTQVASHAQKYYARLQSEGKEKRRPSIHDIRTIHLTDTTTPSFNKCSSIAHPQNSTTSPKVLLDWDHSNGGLMVFDSAQGNPFVAYPYEIGPLNSGFQVQSTRYQIRG